MAIPGRTGPRLCSASSRPFFAGPHRCRHRPSSSEAKPLFAAPSLRSLPPQFPPLAVPQAAQARRSSPRRKSEEQGRKGSFPELSSPYRDGGAPLPARPPPGSRGAGDERRRLLSTSPSPFPALVPPASSACQGERQRWASAGSRGLRETDLGCSPCKRPGGERRRPGNGGIESFLNP